MAAHGALLDCAVVAAAAGTDCAGGGLSLHAARARAHSNAGAIVIFMVIALVGEKRSVPRYGAENKSIV